MAQVVGALQYLGGVLVGTSGTALGTFVARTALAIGLSAVTSKLFAPRIPEARSSLQSLSVTTKDTLEYRKIVYGEAMVSGPVVYQNLSGTLNEYLWSVIALCDGESESIEEVWFDGNQIDKTDIDWTPSATGGGGTGTGEVSDFDYIGTDSENAARVFWTLGDADQVDVSLLTDTFADIDSNFRGRGVTLLGTSLLYNEKTEEIWRKLGEPRDTKALVRGRKCYDRRRDALNADPDFETLAEGAPVGGGLRWFRDDNESEAFGTGLSGGLSVSGGVLTITDNDDSSERLTSEKIPCDSSKRYEVTIQARQTAGDRRHFLGMAFYDSSRNLISPTTETGWGSTGTYFYFGIVDAAFTGSFVTYAITFGTGGTAQIPANAEFMAVKHLLCRNGPVGTETTVELQDAAIFETPSGTLRQSFSLTSRWEWTDNPSVCLADYLTQVVGVDYGDIDWEAAIVAANACDPSVSIPTASTETRFTCNGGLSLGDTHKENIEKILSSFDGRLYWSGGKWRWYASVWEEPTLTIDGDWLTEDSVSYAPFEDSRNRLNTVRGYYIDPSRKYESVEFPPVSVAEYVTRDGETIDYDLELPMTNSQYMCQRLARRLVEQGNNQGTVRLPLNEKGIRLLAGERVNINLPELGIGTIGNLVDQSEDISDATWTKSQTTVSANASRGPFGSAADRMLETVDNDVHLIEIGEVSADLDPTKTYFFSAYVRGHERRYARVILFNNVATTNQAQVIYDLQESSIDTEVELNDGKIFATGIDDLANGWRRIWMFAVPDVNGAATDGIDLQIRVLDDSKNSSYAGDTSKGLDVWGVMVCDASNINDRPSPPMYVPNATGSPIEASQFVGRITNWEANPSGGFNIEVREDRPSAYDDPLEADYTNVAGQSISVPSDIVPPPLSLSAEQVPYGVKLVATPPAAETFDYMVFYASSTSAWSGAVEIARSKTNTYTMPLSSGQTRYFWARTLRNNGDVSTRFPNSDTSTVTSTTGGDVAPVTLKGGNFRDFTVSPANAQVSYRIDSDGNEYKLENSGFDSLGAWLQEGSAGDYDCRLTKNSGDDPNSGDALNTWYACSSDRTWTWTQTTQGNIGGNFTIEIRDGTTNDVLASASVIVIAEEE